MKCSKEMYWREYSEVKIAIVHDYLNQYGGAEKVLEALHEAFPKAPMFTSFFLSKNLPPYFSSFDIRPSFMQNLPLLQRHFKKYLLLYPYAMESFDLKEFDVVLSSSSAFAKGIRVLNNTCHISYCYSPMRFAWETDYYLSQEKIDRVYRVLLPFALSRLRRWDLKTASQVRFFIGISKYIQKKIKKTYNRNCDVIYPPVDLTSFSISKKQKDYFLVLSRQNAYKRIDLVIEAFNRLSLPLIIIGTGSHEMILKKMAKQNIKFLGSVSQAEVAQYMSECRALVFPGVEDFGIAPVEAMASGRPVIAYADGGALETVLDTVTGIFFKEQTPESLMDAVNLFTNITFNPQVIRQHAEQFDKEIFKKKIVEIIYEKAALFNDKKSLAKNYF